MSVDERLVKYASNNTTPLSTMKTFDYPDSFSMSSWSQVCYSFALLPLSIFSFIYVSFLRSFVLQHTISQDVFGHHKNGHMDTSFQNEVRCTRPHQSFYCTRTH